MPKCMLCADLLLDNIFIRFGTKLYRQVLFCYERDYVMSLPNDKRADVIDEFNTTSRYLDDVLTFNLIMFILTIW